MGVNLTDADWQTKIFARENAIECTRDGILEIPEGTEYLDSDFAYFVVREDLPRVHTLIIPKSVKIIETMRGDSSSGPFGYRNNPFCKIVVDEDNAHYHSQDGVLFSKDMKKLICYPCGKPDKMYRIPESVEEIESEAFLNVEHLTEVTDADGLCCIKEHAFTACGHLDFPDFINIYKLRDMTIISFPAIEDSDYHINDERCYCCQTGTSLEPIDEKTFNDYRSEEMHLISDSDERQNVIQLFCSLSESLEYDLDWHFEFEEFANSVSRFKNVFYGDWY